ncbi:hypothetical protein BC833DRAFT_622576 [Globomyces pollinis-pini]|nr:hypothetical protein BC833DRAFT_622576 [Globomyces pollinis-pini]
MDSNGCMTWISSNAIRIKEFQNILLQSSHGFYILRAVFCYKTLLLELFKPMGRNNKIKLWDHLILTNFNESAQVLDMTLDITSTFYGAQTFGDFATSFSDAIDRNINMNNDQIPYIQAIKAGIEEISVFVDTYNDILARYGEYFSKDTAFELKPWVKTPKVKVQPKTLYLDYPLLDSLIYVDPDMSSFAEFLNPITLSNGKSKRTLIRGSSSYQNKLTDYMKENAVDSTIKALLGVGFSKREIPPNRIRDILGDVNRELDPNTGEPIPDWMNEMRLRANNIRATALQLRRNQERLTIRTANLAGNLQNDNNRLRLNFPPFQRLTNEEREELIRDLYTPTDDGSNSEDNLSIYNSDTASIISQSSPEAPSPVDAPLSPIMDADQRITITEFVEVINAVNTDGQPLNANEIIEAIGQNQQSGVFDYVSADTFQENMNSFLANENIDPETKRNVMNKFARNQKRAKLATINRNPGNARTFISDRDFRIQRPENSPTLQRLVSESTSSGRIEAAVDNMIELAGIETTDIPLSNAEAARLVVDRVSSGQLQRAQVSTQTREVYDELHSTYANSNTALSEEDAQLLQNLDAMPGPSWADASRRRARNTINRRGAATTSRPRQTPFRQTRTNNPRQ